MKDAIKNIKRPWLDVEVDTTPRYVIEGSVIDEVWTLSSIVATNFGGDAKNFIFEGSFDDCQLKMEQMKALDEHSRLCQELDNKIENGDNNG